MQRLGKLSLRVCCLRPSPRPLFLGANRAALTRKGLATSGRLLQDGDAKVVVRHYEETAGGKIREVDAGREAEELKARIAQLDKELASLESSGALDSQTIEGEDELGELTKAFQEATEGLEGDAEEDASDRGDALEELGVQFPEYQRIHLQSFNKVLRSVASKDQDFRNNGLLWKKYVLCKQFVPEFVEQISPAVWQVLWSSQYHGNLVMESRTKHLWILVDDMVQAGQTLTPMQKLIRIESLFARGNQDAAMKLWKSNWAQLEKDDATRVEFRELGIRLNAELGRLQDAQELAMEAIKSNGRLRAEDIATLIAAWSQKGDDGSLKVAWSLYLELRRRLGSQMTLEDYDQIVMTFLRVDRPNLALAVFKDLVLSGKRPGQDAAEVQKKSLGLFQELQKHTSDAADVNRVSLASLAAIPKSLENKYFYASWIKRLIGLGEVDSTIPVLALMYQRGIRPDARHMNGIIGAWMRGQDKQRHELALQIAWSMVKERLKFVARRRNDLSSKQENLEVPDIGILVPPHISRNLPPANIETFSLLLLHYERRSMQASVGMVQELLQEAEIAPNSYFMNHLIYAELRQGKVAQAWKIFGSMERNVRPDLETFAALWDCEKVHTAGRSLPGLETFPNPRTLFSRMTAWLSTLSGRPLDATREQFSMELYNQIIRCFCFDRDGEGTIVALYGLREVFGAYPNADTVRLVTIQLARMGEAQAPRRKRSRARMRLSAHPESVNNMNKITDIFKLVSEDRTESLEAVGVDEKSLGEKQRGEELLFKLSKVLRISLRHASGSGVEVISPQEEALDQLAFKMGVGGIDMEPPRYTDRGATGPAHGEPGRA